jgi:two-component system, NarL family, sensor histidine kinase BarA
VTLARFIQSAATPQRGDSPYESHTFADGTPTWAEQVSRNRKEYHYIQAVFFKPACLMDCHGKTEGGVNHIGNHVQKLADDSQHWIKTEPGDLAGAVVVGLPMEQTNKAINSNRAMLITFTLVTAVLAMVSSYLAIHYVIVMPADDRRRSQPGHGPLD